ncbi:MAG: glycosyltransferase [Rothia sp. (in: high G+C Gram-positive bacteria)]|nr:glycosyltransferase [Rothia sp. (in: high G+C Gram-positive bacteria)]
MAVENSCPVVLLCIPVSDFAGVARHLMDIASNGGIPGFDVKFVVPSGELVSRLREVGASVVEAEFGVEAGFTRSFRTLNALIDELRPSIVHTHLAYADVVAAAVVNSRKARRVIQKNLVVPKLVSTEHGIAVDDLVYHGTVAKQKTMETVHRVRHWFTDGAIAVSQFNAVQMKRKWGVANVEVIPNGVDLDTVIMKVQAARVKADTGELRIVSMARLAPEKKIDVLIDAFALVVKERPHARLEIAGKGELREQLEKQVNCLGISTKVCFSGFNDPFVVMGRNDVLVQLSIAENNSYTLLEAKAAGLHVIATAMGGNPEQLEDSEMVPALTATNRAKVVEATAEKIFAIADGTIPLSEGFSWSTTKKMTQSIAHKYKKVLNG